MKHITMDDLLAQDTKRHPSAFFTALREQGPLAYLDDFAGSGGAWMVTTYDDAIEILKDPRFGKDPQKGGGLDLIWVFLKKAYLSATCSWGGGICSPSIRPIIHVCVAWPPKPSRLA
ncbi:MAG: hypothetical protein J2P36_28690 [Ktedonobacteraceae bacterium]|nr:hypothetical protein [Ktedonobacteraceae bacterium]